MAKVIEFDRPCSIRSIGGANTGRAIVYAPGMICPGYESSTELHELWKQHGEVLIVEYGALGRNSSWTTFEPSKIIDAVARQIDGLWATGYERFTLIGASMGGRLLYDVVQARPELTFDYVPVCSPLRGARDVRYPLRALAPARSVITHNLASMLNRFDVLQRATIRPKRENVEPQVDWDQLMDYVRLCYSYRMSFYRDEAVYTLARRKPERLRNMRRVLVIGGSERDDLVTQSALTEAYRSLCADVSIWSDVGHVNFREQPTQWLELFRHTFTLLDRKAW